MSRRSHHPRRRTWRPKLHSTPFAPPGTLSVDPAAPRPVIDLIAYGPLGYTERRITDLREIEPYLHQWPVTWLNVDGLGDTAMIQRIGDRFGVHRLALEDVVHVHQRAKVEQYPDHEFIVARMVEDRNGRVESEQISLFLGRDYLLTFQERPGGDPLEALRQRLRQEGGRIRELGPDYLAYAMLDAVVDASFPVLERFGEQLEALEEAILARPDRSAVGAIHTLKRELLFLRRWMWPFREMAGSLARDGSPLIAADTRMHLRDVHDHCIQALDLIEVYRDLAAGLMDLYLSSINNQMSDVMRVLTMISTVFIPLSVVAGVYGMNFAHMPELAWRWGYPMSLAVMAAIAIAMLIFFWRKGWLASLAAPRLSSVDHGRPNADEESGPEEREPGRRPPA
jgi:magnesium transporter